MPQRCCQKISLCDIRHYTKNWSISSTLYSFRHDSAWGEFSMMQPLSATLAYSLDPNRLGHIHLFCGYAEELFIIKNFNCYLILCYHIQAGEAL